MAKKRHLKKKIAFKLERRPSYKTIYEQVKKIAPLVVEILKSNLESRDDDNVLYIAVWKRQGMKEGQSFRSLKYKLIMGKFASPDSIGRARRRLQSKYSNLRGKLYEERHNAETQMSNQMSIEYPI